MRISTENPGISTSSLCANTRGLSRYTAFQTLGAWILPCVAMVGNVSSCVSRQTFRLSVSLRMLFS